jgi:hypothetical protein
MLFLYNFISNFCPPFLGNRLGSMNESFPCFLRLRGTVGLLSPPVPLLFFTIHNF